MLYSIPELPSLTEREVIERSVRHVLKNGKPSVGLFKPPDAEAYVSCSYDGIGCAAAPFLIPEHRKDADSLKVNWPALLKYEVVNGAHCELIHKLQCCHDMHTMSYQVHGPVEYITRYKRSLVDMEILSNDDPLLTEDVV